MRPYRETIEPMERFRLAPNRSGAGNVLSRLAALIFALTLGVAAPCNAGFYSPLIGPRIPVRLMLQAVTVEVQHGHESVFEGLHDFREALSAGIECGSIEELDSFDGRIEFFDSKRLALSDDRSVEIRPFDRDLPGRLRLILAQQFSDSTESEVLTIRLDHQVGFEQGFATVPLEGERQFLAVAVELRR